MDTAGAHDVVCNLVQTGTLVLEHKASPNPWYKGLLVSGEMVIVADCLAHNVQLYRLHDGKLLATSQRLESPRDICHIYDMYIGVIMANSKIEILSVQCIGDTGIIRRVRTLHANTGFVICHAAVKFMNTLVVSGDKQDTMCWCIVSLDDGHVDTIYQICQGYGQSYLTTKNNMLYISCQAGPSSSETGLRAYNIQNPSIYTFVYTNNDLKLPSGVTVDRRGFIFVCNEDPPCIHHLTDRCELVSIYKGMPSCLNTIFWDQHLEQLYIACSESNVITRYRPVYSDQKGVPVEILNMDDRSIQLFEEALKAGKENVYNIRVMVVGHLGVGKTTLIKRLLGEEVDISERHSTEGIDVHVNCCDVSLSTLKWTRREKVNLSERFMKLTQSERAALEDEIQDYILTPKEELPKFDRDSTSLEQFFCQTFGNLTLPTGRKQFKLIGELSRVVLTLPHSNADNKRTFSILRKIQADSRGNLNPVTVHNLLSVKMNNDKDCYQYNPGNDLVRNAKNACVTYMESVKGNSEEDYKLQRLVKVLNKDYRSRAKDADEKQVASPPQRERTVSNPAVHVADYDRNTVELLYSWSTQQDVEQNLSSTANQEESLSGIGHRNPTHSETNAVHVADYDRNTVELLYSRSTQQDAEQNLSSTASQQEESPSAIVQRNPTNSETNTIPKSKLVENIASGSHQMDSVREMLSLLQENAGKAIQDVDKYASLTMWDFAGQYAFYTTHQMFLTRRAIYLLVSDVSGHVSDFVEDDCYFDSEGIIKCRVHELVEVWLNSIHSCAPPDKENMNSTYSQTPPDKVIPPPVILVGTHVDQIPQNPMNTFGNYGSHSVVPGFAGGYNPGVRNPFQYDVQAPRNPMNTFGNYGSHSVIPGFAGGYNPGVRNPFQYDVQAPRNPMNTFGNYGSHSVVPGFAGGYNPGVRNPFQYDVQAPRNPMNTFGNYGSHSVIPGFAGGYNPGVRNPFQYDVQAPRNPMNTFGNYGGHSVVPGFAGGYNPTVRNHFQYDAQAPRNPMNTFGNYGSHSVVPGFAGGYNPGVRNPFQYDVQAPRNQMNMFGNYGGQIVMPGFPVDNILDIRNPIKFQRDYCHEHGRRYLREIRSHVRDKPTTVHLVDEDFAIDNTVVDIKLEELKRKIIEVASQQPYWGEEIPTRWLPLEQQLMKLKDAGVKVISRNTVEDLNKEGNVRIENSEELDLFLRYLHETGTIIYFSIEVLRENIVLDPKCLIDALKSLINAQPNLPKSPADNGAQSVIPPDGDADSAVIQKWSDFKEKGILTIELVDAIWTKEKHPDLHTNKVHILLIMEQLNIIAKPRSFSEIGEKVENYFLTPCMLRQESPREVISPEQDPRMVNTSVLCCVFTGKFLPPPIFHRLLAACVAHWPVAKKTDTSENLIFCGCCVFDLDLFHRLTLHFKNHVVFARITRMVVDEVKIPDAKLCSKVRRFITLNLDKITSYLGQNLQYELCVQNPPFHDLPKDSMICFSSFQMWLADEGHDPDAPIRPEHMNHARLCVALVTVCGNALREVLHSHVPAPHTDIYQAILANQNNLTSRRQVRPGQWQNALLNQDQSQVVFPDPQGRYMAALEQLDISLLYTLIRNVSTVPAPLTGWAMDPQSGDRSLGASVERIRSYRNHISGHSADGMVSQQDFENYWSKINLVIHDIEAIIGRQVCSHELEQQRMQVISIYEAC